MLLRPSKRGVGRESGEARRSLVKIIFLGFRFLRVISGSFQRENGFPVSWKSGNELFPHFLSTSRYIGSAGNELPVKFPHIE